MPIYGVLGFVSMMVILFMSAFLLERRQRMLDAGKQSLGERIEKVLYGRRLLVLPLIVMGWVAWYTPIWTPRHDIHHVYTGAQLSGLLFVPIASALLLFSLSLLVVSRADRMKKVVRLVLFAAGVGILVYANSVICYGGDDGAVASDWYAMAVMGLPLAIMIGLVVDIFIASPRGGSLRSWQKT